MDMLDICIKQGYVPPDCKLDGAIAFMIVRDGKIRVMDAMLTAYIKNRHIVEKFFMMINQKEYSVERNWEQIQNQLFM